MSMSEPEKTKLDLQAFCLSFSVKHRSKNYFCSLRVHDSPPLRRVMDSQRAIKGGFLEIQSGYRLQQRAMQNHGSHTEIDDKTRYINQGSHEGRRGRSGIKPQAVQEKRQH